MTISLGDFLQFANDITVIVLLLTILVGLYKKWWVPGWLYEDAVRRSDEWQEVATRSLNVAEKKV